jgi:MFS family permease
MVGIGSLLVVCLPQLAVIVGAQATLGAASAIIPPALSALSLGIFGRKLFPARVSRDGSFNHGGNFAAAILAGMIGQRFGYQWIFYLVCLFALPSAAAVALIRPQEIDHEMARGGEDKDSSAEIGRVLIGLGRDAADVPITMAFGKQSLEVFRVLTEEIVDFVAVSDRPRRQGSLEGI